LTIAVRRLSLAVLIAAIMCGCSPPAIATPFAAPAAATVDGHDISMAAYQARLQVSRARDPFAGIPEAIPTPVPKSRLEDFTIEQLIREEIVRQEAESRRTSTSDQAVQARVAALQSRAGSSQFNAALDRNGFTIDSFRAYERALLNEVALLQAMAKDRVTSAMADLKAGKTFGSVAASWSDDSGTMSRNGDVGWLRPSDIPEPELASAVSSLAPGGVTGIVRTNRGFTIATVLERRNDQVHLAVILVLAPTVDVFSPQGTPAWFTTFIGDRESALQRDGKITVRVGSQGRQ
jgi:parvulin-like peptidyl-prolyl isomerase